MKMSTGDEQSRKRERDHLFHCLHRALPEEEKNVLKEYAKKTLQDKPPTMGKTEVSTLPFAVDCNVLSTLRSPSTSFMTLESFYQFMIHVLAIADKYQKDLVPGFQKHFSPHLASMWMSSMAASVIIC